MSTMLNQAHGTRRRYVKGCRCDPCREANARYSILWSASRRGVMAEWPPPGMRRITPGEYQELRNLAKRNKTR